MRILGILALLVSAVGVALVLVRDAEHTLLRTRSLVKLLGITRDSVGMYAMSAPEILKKCGNALIEACGYPTKRKMPDSFLEMSLECDIPDGETRAAFVEFAKDFGKSYRAQEVQRCELCIERLRKRERTLASELPGKKKIIFSVSLCSALVLLILLL